MTSDAFLGLFPRQMETCVHQNSMKIYVPQCSWQLCSQWPKAGGPQESLVGAGWADHGPRRCRALLSISAEHAAEHTTGDPQEEASLRGDPLCGPLHQE